MYRCVCGGRGSSLFCLHGTSTGTLCLVPLPHTAYSLQLTSYVLRLTSYVLRLGMLHSLGYTPHTTQAAHCSCAGAYSCCSSSELPPEIQHPPEIRHPPRAAGVSYP